MELRSQTFNKLVDILKGAGVYEEGMDMEEMRNLAEAMQISTVCPQPSVDPDLERALLESELEFMYLHPAQILNSTMIVPHQEEPIVIPESSPERDCDSPPTAPIHMTVRALVHHPLDWSPTSQRRSLLKRPSVSNSPGPVLGGKRVGVVIRDCGERGDQPGAPREYNPDDTPISVVDSGVSSQEISLSSLSSEGSPEISIGEMPSRHLISTSSAAVSDFSSSHDQENQE
ncbi:hypothetical protein KR074_010753 [Drosophila pseudoananassae]|nr:hypothetical protein KR074_010753 [Drosophila pseudoananassae]